MVQGAWDNSSEVKCLLFTCEDLSLILIPHTLGIVVYWYTQLWEVGAEGVSEASLFFQVSSR